MTVAGMCYICFQPAVRSCRSCGMMVCLMHYDESSGVCAKCKGAKAKGAS